ncbi:hypothetical protein TWF694_002465 [Orbilia ellipsospora]|uniref:PH domain-containing protein n=1 Tax=Orbilia ellipsospora TaxID=2528407 RepID=A0AAV9X3E3_9PEZI
MAQVLSPIPSVSTATGMAPIPTVRPENRSLSLDIATAFSPVDERGAFMHDKIFKESWLHQRTRKTKNWKRRWYVLRGSAISIYKDSNEKKLHRQIQLSDLTACAPLKDAKRPHVFGLFSPARNFHLQASSDKELDEWVRLVRDIACLEETDEPIAMSPVATEAQPIPVPRRASQMHGPSSPTSRPQDGVGSFTLDYSGASMSSTSELGGMVSQSSLAMPLEPGNTVLRPTSPPATAQSAATAASVISPTSTTDPVAQAPPETGVQRKESGLSNLEGQMNDSRVVWHGYLYVLKSKSGIRQWKKIWVVLRPRNVTFYKNEEEYRPLKLIPLENIIDVVEIDPISKSKQNCMQMILEKKSYKFAAGNEESLTKWLGALKSTLAKSRR